MVNRQLRGGESLYHSLFHQEWWGITKVSHGVLRLQVIGEAGGDFKDLVRLVCSDDSMTNRSHETFMALKDKYPSPSPYSYIPTALWKNGKLIV